MKTHQEQFIRSDAPTATCTGDTGRTTRLNEHKRATKKGDFNNKIAEHHLKTSLTIYWDSATCLTYRTDYQYCLLFILQPILFA